MAICQECKAQYEIGRSICSHCGMELYKNLFREVPMDEYDVPIIKKEVTVVDESMPNLYRQEWVKLIDAQSQFEADIILKQLNAKNIPTMKKDIDLPFDDILSTGFPVEVYVPKNYYDSAYYLMN